MALFYIPIPLAARAVNATIIAWEIACRDDPSLPQCEFIPSFYGYRINLIPNAVFLALFCLSFLGYTAVYAITRRGVAFTIAFQLGLLCEILGYAGRIMSWKNQWLEDGFLMQICCLTIGPAFMAAGVYLCLRRIVYAFGKENSRIRPEWYTRVFIPCDVLSLILQALGGALASVAEHQGRSVDLGDHIMIAGLSFQVFTLLIFMLCTLDFALRAHRRRRALGADAAFDQSDAMRRVRGSWRFRAFLGALALATVCIFWRSVFRVAELSGGWSGTLMKRQDLFVGFEGVMVVVASLVLNVFHPSLCFRELMEGAGGLGYREGKAEKKGKPVETPGEGKSEPVSDDGGVMV